MGLLRLDDVGTEVEAASELASISSTSGVIASDDQMLAFAVNGPASNASEAISRIAINRGIRCMVHSPSQQTIVKQRERPVR